MKIMALNTAEMKASGSRRTNARVTLKNTNTPILKRSKKKRNDAKQGFEKLQSAAKSPSKHKE